MWYTNSRIKTKENRFSRSFSTTSASASSGRLPRWSSLDSLRLSASCIQCLWGHSVSFSERDYCLSVVTRDGSGRDRGVLAEQRRGDKRADEDHQSDAGEVLNGEAHHLHERQRNQRADA